MVPKRILSIEVIDKMYVVGNISYGGFINIVSKNGDMGGIDLPENSLFFRYRGFPEVNDTDPESHGMEFRNCLYWEPDLSLEPEQTRNVSFQSVDQPGMYRMIIRGVAEDGSYLSGQCSFRIEP